MSWCRWLVVCALSAFSNLMLCVVRGVKSPPAALVAAGQGGGGGGGGVQVSVKKNIQPTTFLPYLPSFLHLLRLIRLIMQLVRMVRNGTICCFFLTAECYSRSDGLFSRKRCPYIILFLVRGR